MPARRPVQGMPLASACAMIVISPHFDDAVFACGQRLSLSPASSVVTVFADVPGHASQLTEWDARCGFASAAQAIARRREEDLRALDELGASAVWLPFPDGQYGEVVRPHDVGRALASVLQALPCGGALEEVLFPLGLFHADHLLTHAAAMAAMAAVPAAPPRLLAYEDALYRDKPGLLQARLAALACDGWMATPEPVVQNGPGARRKAVAVQAYRSQLAPLGATVAERLMQPERVWRLERQRG